MRWQAPELLSGQSRLTAAMDVYAFAICCIEILSMGRMPWPLLDDEIVRHLVLSASLLPLTLFFSFSYLTCPFQPKTTDQLRTIMTHASPIQAYKSSSASAGTAIRPSARRSPRLCGISVSFTWQPPTWRLKTVARLSDRLLRVHPLLGTCHVLAHRLPAVPFEVCRARCWHQRQ